MKKRANEGITARLRELLAARHWVEAEDGTRRRVTGGALLAERLFSAAARGDWTAYKLVLELSGEAVRESVDPELVAAIEAAVYAEA